MISEEAFLRAIWADPDDDAKRAVYADWLVERGDPRGELIQLQLTHAAGRSSPRSLTREHHLLLSHRAAWLGPIWQCVKRTPHLAEGRTFELRFERGFLHEAVTHFHGGSAPADDRWRTARVLYAKDNRLEPDGRLWAPALALYTSEALFGLRELWNAHRDAAIALLARAAPRPLHALGVAADPLGDADLRYALEIGDRLPELRELSLLARAPPVLRAYDWLFATPAGSRLETLALSRIPSEPRVWLARRDSPPRLRTIRFFESGATLTLERVDGRWITAGLIR